MLCAGGLFCLEPVDVADENVMGDLAAPADPGRADVAGGDKAVHEGSAYAQQIRCFLDWVPGQPCRSWLVRGDRLVWMEPSHVADECAAGDPPDPADPYGVDLAGGDEVKHVGPAHAQPFRRLGDRVGEPSWPARVPFCVSGHRGPASPRGQHGPVRGPSQTSRACVVRAAAGPARALFPVRVRGPGRCRGAV